MRAMLMDERRQCRDERASGRQHVAVSGVGLRMIRVRGAKQAITAA
jgi:hypothetical protein